MRQSGLLAVGMLVLASCASGGSGCGGCTGSKIAGGLPDTSVVANGGTVRVTRPGLDFFSQNFNAVLTSVLRQGRPFVRDPKRDQCGHRRSRYLADICINGPMPNATPPQCVVDIQIGKSVLRFDSATPNNLRISGTIPIRLKNLPIVVDVPGPFNPSPNVGLGVGGCQNDAPNVDYKAFPITIDLPIVAETRATRKGLARRHRQRSHQSGHQVVGCRSLRIKLGLYGGLQLHEGSRLRIDQERGGFAGKKCPWRLHVRKARTRVTDRSALDRVPTPTSRGVSLPRARRVYRAFSALSRVTISLWAPVLRPTRRPYSS